MKKRILSFVFILVVSLVGLVQCGFSLQIEKQQKAMRELRNFDFAINSYVNENGRAPESDFYTIIRSYFESNNIPVPSAKDPWGHDYLYFRNTKNHKEYALGCSGRDGIFKGWAQLGEYAMEDLDDFDQDIIYSNDEFTFAPKVKKVSGRHEEPDLGEMDKKELIARYYDLRLQQIEVDRLVRMLDNLDSGLRTIEAKAIRIELLKLEQRRVLKILENISSVIAPANSYAEKICLKGDLLDLSVVVLLPGVIEQVLLGLESKGCFAQVGLVQKPGNAAGALGKIRAVISCRYNIADVGAEPIFASATKKDYQSIRHVLSQRLNELEASQRLSREQENKAGNEVIEGLAKGEIILRINNIKQQIKYAESQEYRLAGIRKENERLHGRLENLKDFLPNKSEIEKTRMELFSMIKNAGVVIVNSRALPVKMDVSYIEQPIAFSIKGDYTKLRQLFDQLANAKHIFMLKEFELTEKKDNYGVGGFKGDMIVSFLLYNEKG